MRVLEAYVPEGRMNVRGAASRGAILDAARQILGTQGLSKLSLATIARAARCSKASVLYHFGTRDGVLIALIAEGASFFLATLESAFSSYEPGDGGIEGAIATAMAALFREENRLLLSAERELAGLGVHDPVVAAELARGVERLVDSITRFGMSIELGPDAEDLRARALCMIAATFGQIELWLCSGDRSPALHREAAIRSARAIALEGL